MIIDPLNSQCRKLKSNPFVVACPNDDLKVFKEQRRRRPITEEEYLALCLLKLSRGGNNLTATTTVAMQGFSTSEPPRPTSNTQPFRHKCGVCSKSFSSYQALGGHKTSHSRRNASIAPSLIDEISISATGLIPIDVRSNNKSYECSVCRKKFRTGQALGGHKRCHYEGRNIIDGTLLDYALTTNGNISKSRHSKGQDFDLNLPALPEFKNFDEEDEVEVVPIRIKKARLFLSLKSDLLHV